MSEEVRQAIYEFPIHSYLSGRPGFEDRGGDYLRLNCPICSGRRTLSVNRRTKVAHCFKCDEGGAGLSVWNGKTDIAGLICLFEGISRSAAWKKILSTAGVQETYSSPRFRDDRRELPKESVRLGETCYHEAAEYLRKRGVSHLLQDARVCIEGKYSGRLILPSQFFGKVNGFEAKSYCGQTPKALYPTWMRTGELLYATRQWDNAAGFAVLTESIIDAETLGTNGIGIFGSVLRQGQLALLLSLRSRGIRKLVWMLDADAMAKTANAIQRKTFMWFENFIADLPEGEDPNSIGHAECWKAVASARPMTDLFDSIPRRKFSSEPVLQS